jgi:Ni,Fe-hydrogenase III small subunit
MGLSGAIRRAGRVAEPAPALPANADTSKTLRGSLSLRHVDAGSCNGCEIEISGAFSPVYDAERYGARLVASPRHADGLLVTGVVTQNMLDPLRDAYVATPAPKVVLAVGDCARNCGRFAGSYAVAGAVADVVPVDVEVPGCPPTPAEIIDALRQITGR